MIVLLKLHGWPESRVALAIIRRGSAAIRRFTLFGYLFLATASHGILDAMTNGGLGVAFCAVRQHSLFPAVATNPSFTNRHYAVLHDKRIRHSLKRSCLDLAPRDPVCIPCVDIASERGRGRADGSESMIVGRKPPNHAALELLSNHANCTTVTCAWNFPERYIIRIVATNSLRLLERILSSDHH